MLQKYLITLYAIVVGLASALFSPYIAVANSSKEPPCEDIRKLNRASQEWCRYEKGWGKDSKGRWMQLKGKKEVKTPGAGIVDNTNDKSQPTSVVNPTKPPQTAVSVAPKKRSNRLPSKGSTKKVIEQQIFWTEGMRIPNNHIGHLPKGGWR